MFSNRYVQIGLVVLVVLYVVWHVPTIKGFVVGTTTT